MSQSDIERELDRRCRELVGSLLQACRDQRNRAQAAGPVDTGVESAERCEHDDGESTSDGVQVRGPGRQAVRHWPPDAGRYRVADW